MSSEYEDNEVYKVTDDLPETIIEKGDQLYLNNEYKDRLELFTERGDFKVTLDLNGKIMVDASKKSCGKKLETDEV